MQELRVDELIDQAISAYDLRLERLESEREITLAKVAYISLAKKENKDEHNQRN